jgi:predicted PurR-regulated permease PerM
VPTTIGDGPAYPPTGVGSSSVAQPAAGSLPSLSTETEPLLQVGAVDVRHTAFTLVAVATTIALLYFMQAVLIPLVLAALLFYALDPVVDRLQAWRVPRLAGALAALLAVVGGVTALSYVLQGQVTAVVDQLPDGARRFRELVQQVPGSAPGTLNRVQEAADELQKSAIAAQSDTGELVRVQVQPPAFDATPYVWTGGLTVLSLLSQVVMVLFLTFFLLLSDDLFKRKLVEAVGPTLSRKRLTVKILEDAADQIERFLLIQLVTSAIVAVATWLALWMLGLQQAGFWGVMAGIFNSIPYYGPLVVTASLAGVAFLQFGTLGQTLLVAGVALVITTLEGFLLTPALTGRVAQMNTVAIFVGLLFWSWLWGIPGMLLAVPMMMVAKAVCDHVDELQRFGRFLGE